MNAKETRVTGWSVLGDEFARAYCLSHKVYILPALHALLIASLCVACLLGFFLSFALIARSIRQPLVECLPSGL